MTSPRIPPSPNGIDLRVWAARMTSYLQDTLGDTAVNPPNTTLLSHKMATRPQSAAITGLLMYDPVAKNVLLSYDNDWHPLLGQEAANGLYVKKTGDIMTGVLHLESTAPRLTWHDTNGTSTMSRFSIVLDADLVQFQTRDETNTLKGTIWRANMAANGVSKHEWLITNGVMATLDASGFVVEHNIRGRSLYARNDAETYMYFSDIAGKTKSRFVDTTSGELRLEKYNAAGSTYATSFRLYDDATPAIAARIYANATLQFTFDIGTGLATTTSVVTRATGDARYSLASSKRYKTDITEANETELDILFSALMPVEFTWAGEIPKHDTRYGHPAFGFIAEDLTDERLVTYRYKTDEEGNETEEREVQGIDPLAMIAVLAAKIRVMEKRING